VVNNKNGGPHSQQKDSTSQLQWKKYVSQWKTRTKQNSNPNFMVATEFIPERGWPRVGGDQGGAHNMGLSPDMIQRPTCPKIGDVAPCHGYTEWSTNFLELGPEPKVSFPMHQRTSRFDVVWGSCGWFCPRWSAESEPNTESKLMMTCNLAKAMTCAYPPWWCRHQRWSRVLVKAGTDWSKVQLEAVRIGFGDDVSKRSRTPISFKDIL
jgi:hypothetical protein